MDNIVDLNEFRKKKEEKAEKEMAEGLYNLLSELMLDDEPVVISLIDSNGNETRINLDDVLGLSDSNYTPF
jgi:hypothetical protein